MSARNNSVCLSVDASLLREARDRGINLSDTFERALRDVLRDDRLTIATYNDQVEAHGAFADTRRGF